ncbi:MAG: hypothetical protein LBT05_08920 [Planctomycetaceae bacterium]|jgi:hypothetical protein|nr:hypothetical protein [Planctomycetaceae bacterium]
MSENKKNKKISRDSRGMRKGVAIKNIYLTFFSFNQDGLAKNQEIFAFAK